METQQANASQRTRRRKFKRVNFAMADTCVMIEQMDECSKREMFIAAVQTLTQEEQRRLWKELEKHGIIKSECTGRV